MKLMIVDDDDQIREGMAFGIQWDNLGIEEVQCLKNGKDALQCLEHAYFDIIISDISMPVMSGIELMREVRKKYSEICFILISGYKEFEYAQAGIRYGAEGYILKPIHLNELLEIVTKVTEKIEQRKEDTQNRELAIELGKNQVIRQIIQKKITNPDEIKDFLIGKNGFEKIHTLLGVVIEDDNKTETDERIKKIFIKKITEFLAGYTYAIFDIHTNEQFLLIDVVDSTLRIFHLKQQICRMIEMMNREMKEQSFSAGISKQGNLTDISYLYECANNVLEYRFTYGKGSCLDYAICEEEAEKKKRNFQHEEWNQKIMGAIENGTKTDLEAVIEGCKKALTGNEKLFIRKFFSQNVLQISQMQKMKMQENQIERAVFEADTFEEAIFCWTSFLNNVRKRREEEDKYTSDILKALDYIHEHYMEKVTVEQVAEYLEISEGYFSRRFKQQVKVSFVKYLNQYRIDKAEALLSSTNLKVYEIAEQVGIPDYIYFTQVFRNLKGMSPTDLRK